MCFRLGGDCGHELAAKRIAKEICVHFLYGLSVVDGAYECLIRPGMPVQRDSLPLKTAGEAAHAIVRLQEVVCGDRRAAYAGCFCERADRKRSPLLPGFVAVEGLRFKFEAPIGD